MPLSEDYQDVLWSNPMVIVFIQYCFVRHSIFCCQVFLYAQQVSRYADKFSIFKQLYNLAMFTISGFPALKKLYRRSNEHSQKDTTDRVST